MIKIDCYVTLGVDREYDLTAARLIQAMDRAGVDQAVIAPLDRCLAVDNSEGNRFLIEQARLYPDRLIPACSANPWYRRAALAEVRRAIEDGARMLVLHPFLQGFLADDEIAWPLLELAAQERIPVYIHTGFPGNSTPWQMVHLAEHFPALSLIMGHSGSTDFWNDVNPAMLAAPGLYIETSLARPFSVPGRIQVLGSRRVIMGSYAPLNDFCFEWEQMAQVLPPEACPDVLGGNLERLLELRGKL